MPAPKVDWTKLRDEYVMGDESVTTRGLAAKHRIHPSSVTNHCRRDDWPGQRRAYRAQVSRRAEDKAVASVSEIRARHARYAREIVEIAHAGILQHLIVKGEDGKTKILVQEPDQLRRLIKDLMEQERKAVGIEERVRVELASGLRTFLDLCQHRLPEASYRIVEDIAAELTSSVEKEGEVDE